VEVGWEFVGMVVTMVTVVTAAAFAVSAAAWWLRKKRSSTADKAILRIWQDLPRSVKHRRRGQSRPPPRIRDRTSARLLGRSPQRWQ
jgi:hypothetical protein